MAMVESLRTAFIGSQTRPSNEYAWCNETAVPTSINQYLPELEIDQTPFTYRQEFQSQVGQRGRNDFHSSCSSNQEHFNWYGNSELYGSVIISYKYSLDPTNQRIITGIVR
jgi:hypothetical protein